MTMSEPPYHVDIDGLDGADDGRRDASGAEDFRGRPWVGIQFSCCHVYARIYRNRDGTAYHGACPRCGRSVKLTVGPGGTSSRFFVAD